MKTHSKLLIAVAVAVAVPAVGATAAAATAGGGGGDDGEMPVTGRPLEQATAAALAHTGGGRVTDTEAGDEESYYEIEVTLDDGAQLDVQLDRDFRVVSDETDGDEGEDG